MTVAALYDVHGNLPALEAVLAEVEREGIETIVAGGDVVWGPLPRECVALLHDAGALFLAGNCERDVLRSANASCLWCLDQLDDETRGLVAAWPSTVELDIEGLGRVIFCHATPLSDEAILTRDTPEETVAEVLEPVTADVVVCGHTHVQYDLRVPRVARLVNAGSVGLPYEGSPGARWAALGPTVELRRTTYDVEEALARLLAPGFPSVENIFPESLRGLVTAASASEHFEAKRLGA